ncbi:hypothetical protein OEZ71_13265 [Defluviimonas sp. WL0050]|uniref:Uncharacterized protein n=1 Tax=Albidovulum litorale TaxID=2984134 RepID=A0ABT2ZQ36_9RHOB|nr:hypothetical protein [Defluviimonas sp. WL0050]MCV2873264.1 hypothetical protein [Defluviimonas sp. WL0050]
MQRGNRDRVARRRVFYIPGYDPFHPRRYRELYRSEARAQSEISGYDVAFSPRRPGTAHGWQVVGRMERGETEAGIEVLVWSDIVRSSMAEGIIATYGQLARTAWTYVASGVIFRVMRLRKGPTIAALYPVVVLLLQLFVATAAGWGAALLLGRGLGAAGIPPEVGWIGGVVLVWAVLWRFRALDGRIYAYYLMHDYAFTAQEGGAYPAVLEARLAQFADRVAAELQEDWDEVLVVGHSSGVHLAVSVLADLIRAGRVPASGPALGFLSLGHVVPMAAFLPRARRLRADLAFLSARDELTWVDVTAPGDGCAFALCDPVSVTGVAPPGKRWPLVISAAFTQTLSPERWQALKRRYFRLHFQYLCAFDRPGDYDYFRITAGPQTLSARFRDRKPSQSRIERVANHYRDIA